jgi:hypothetical protein
MEWHCLAWGISVVVAVEGVGLLVVAALARRRGNGLGEIVRDWPRNRW